MDLAPTIANGADRPPLTTCNSSRWSPDGRYRRQANEALFDALPSLTRAPVEVVIPLHQADSEELLDALPPLISQKPY